MVGWLRRIGSFFRSRRVVSWSAQELYDRLSTLDDDMLRELGQDNIDVIDKMLSLMPNEPRWDADRVSLMQLRSQLVFPSARLCTIAAFECDRIKRTGVFDEWLRQQSS